MCLMALLFKMLAVLFYFTFKLGFGLDISTFVVVVLMECFDFWVTKNLTGRYVMEPIVECSWGFAGGVNLMIKVRRSGCSNLASPTVSSAKPTPTYSGPASF